MKNKFDEIIEKLFCKHNWKKKYAHKIVYEGKIKKIICVLICENCGKIKKVKVDIFS